MNFKEKLEALLANPSEGSITEFLTDISGLEEKANSVESLVSEVKDLEGKYSKATIDLAKSSDSINLVKNTLGLDDINEEVLSTKIKKSDNADVKNLEQIIEKMKEESGNKVKDYESQIFDLKLNDAISRSGHSINASGARAHEIIMSELKKDAVLDDNGKVVYQKDGAIERKDGLPISIADKISTLKESEDYNGLFRTDAKSGSGDESISTAVSTGATSQVKSLQQRMRDHGVQL